MTQPPDLLSTSELASLARVHPTTVQRWVNEEKIEAIRLPSGVLRFRRSEVERLGLLPSSDQPRDTRPNGTAA